MRFHVTLKTSTDEQVRADRSRSAGTVAPRRRRPRDCARWNSPRFFSDVAKGNFQLNLLRWVGANNDPDILRICLLLQALSARRRQPRTLPQPAHRRADRPDSYGNGSGKKEGALQRSAKNPGRRSTLPAAVVHRRRLRPPQGPGRPVRYAPPATSTFSTHSDSVLLSFVGAQHRCAPACRGSTNRVAGTGQAVAALDHVSQKKRRKDGRVQLPSATSEILAFMHKHLAQHRFNLRDRDGALRAGFPSCRRAVR